MPSPIPIAIDLSRCNNRSEKAICLAAFDRPGALMLKVRRRSGPETRIALLEMKKAGDEAPLASPPVSRQSDHSGANGPRVEGPSR